MKRNYRARRKHVNGGKAAGLDAEMRVEATPILIVGDADDPGPFLTIKTLCSRCRRVIASRQIDVRLADKVGHGPPERLAVEDGTAWNAHAARGCRLRPARRP